MFSADENAAFPHRLADCAAAVTKTLDGLLTAEPAAGETERPARLLAAMRHAALPGGKRLRPFLLIETARLFGIARDRSLLAAAAVECLHTYSLIHDDLPAMDDDDLRRGKPTVHKAFDEATAILAGDALQALAFDILSRPETHANTEVRSELVAVLARAAGVGGMAGGQMLDLQAEGSAADAATIRRIQAMKTGALFAASCEMGAVLGKARSEARLALQKYGQALGRAFQIADDFLDLEASPAELGKATAKDAGRGKATLVRLLGADATRSLVGAAFLECEKHLSALPGDTSILAVAARFAVERRR
jgi:farnesyl diphosphate synthase